MYHPRVSTAAREKVCPVEGHKCSLPQKEDLISFYISGGIFVNLRRHFRQWLMVNASNPEAKAVLKSSAHIRWEESRHLRKYYHMVHPFSKFKSCWQTIMIVVYICLFVVQPLECVLLKTPMPIVNFKLFLDLICLLDVGLYFATGYFDHDTRKVVMNPTKVCKRYIFGYFLVDFVGSLPYNAVIVYTENYQLYFLKFFYLFRVLRLTTLVHYIKKFFYRLGLWGYWLEPFGLSIIFFVSVWWATAIVYLVYNLTTQGTYISEDNDELNFASVLLLSSMQVVKTFCLVENSSIQSHDIVVQIFYCVMVFGGYALSLVVFTYVSQVYRRHFSSRNRYDRLLAEITEFINYKELPASLQDRILRFVEFKFHKNIFKEGDILDTLSHVLKEDVMLHICKSMVERVDFFKNIPSDIILEIVNKIRPEIYLPGDMIVKAGTQGQAMYFIYVGTVAVYSVYDTEICHLEDGDHFGEISLVINEPRVATVIAVTDCELYKLNRKDFLEMIEPYPSIYNKMKETALSRLQKTKKLNEMESGSEFEFYNTI